MIDLASLPAFAPAPVTLQGRHVTLEPLAEAHADVLFPLTQQPAIWEWYIDAMPTDVDVVRGWISAALSEQQAGRQIPFLIRNAVTGAALGSTRLMDILPKHRGVEIGWTWLTPQVWRSAVNTECKYLLLRHCFETLGALRVVLKTDELNTRSRRAIERLGASFEGILSHHMVTDAGRIRHTALYAIPRPDWPRIKAGLAAKMAP